MAQASNQAKIQFGYRRHPDQDRAGQDVAGHPVVVVGAGPVGLSLAIDLAQRGHRVVLLDDADRIGEGSRAICFSKRSLEYWDRLGVGDRMVAKGVVWSVGRIFHGDSQLYQFNLLAEQGHKRPAFINLQQFYAEAYLVDRVGELPAIDLRWRNKVVGLDQRNDDIALAVETPDGRYGMRAQFVIACDGARSSLRKMVGAEFSGQVFEDQFLIADVKMTAAFPTERWFWFDPPFHAGRSALLHKQPDDVWRIDLQLSRYADPAVEKIEKAYQGLKDIRGNFVQKSFIKDFDRTDTFKGTFLMKMPSRMRWQYSGGDKQNTEVVINNDEMIIYQKQDKQAFKSRFDREIYGQAPIALLSGFSDIGKEFEITKKDGRLLLKPKRPMGNVLSLAITPSDKDFPIASLTIFDKRSNRIDITFTDVTVNTGIPESAFDFSLPKGASVYDYK